MTVFFSADFHLGHSNIIKYCGRPFENVHEMNEKIIENYNAIVAPDDHLYFLGDFSFCSPGLTIEFLKRLHGKKFMIQGNHDKALTKEEVRPYIEWLKDYHKLSIQDKDAARGVQDIVLMHYAMRVWDKSHWGAWQLYGHSHGSLPDDPNALAIDVGVDCHNFKPITYDEIKVIMSKKKFVPVDHHKE
jgi:calcineurin-like phosphoesterase family protein